MERNVLEGDEDKKQTNRGRENVFGMGVKLRWYNNLSENGFAFSGPRQERQTLFEKGLDTPEAP